MNAKHPPPCNGRTEPQAPTTAASEAQEIRSSLGTELRRTGSVRISEVSRDNTRHLFIKHLEAQTPSRAREMLIYNLALVRGERSEPAQIEVSSKNSKRETLRALRAAEMAAWEAAPPSTRIPRETCRRVILPSSHRRQTVARRFETFVLLLLAFGALASVVIGTGDLVELLTSWKRVAQSLRDLLG